MLLTERALLRGARPPVSHHEPVELLLEEYARQMASVLTEAQVRRPGARSQPHALTRTRTRARAHARTRARAHARTRARARARAHAHARVRVGICLPCILAHGALAHRAPRVCARARVLSSPPLLPTALPTSTPLALSGTALSSCACVNHRPSTPNPQALKKRVASASELAQLHLDIFRNRMVRQARGEDQIDTHTHTHTRDTHSCT
jgi:hypothetical protein